MSCAPYRRREQASSGGTPNAGGVAADAAADTEGRICDYATANYRESFWDGRGRDYEDGAERVAIRRLLPPSGERLLELGAGFGRLTNLYTGYRQVVLVDYNRSHLEQARDRYGLNGFLYVAADIYRLPFAPGQFDAATMVRTLHHMEKPAAALAQARMALRRGGVLVLEYTNKRNVRAVSRWFLGQGRRLLSREAWSASGCPFSREPLEFYSLYYGFHPDRVGEMLRQVGFDPGRRLAVSYLRSRALKRMLPAPLLVALDGTLQWTGDWLQFSPSGFVRAEAAEESAAETGGDLWRCPACGGLRLVREPEAMRCSGCGACWEVRDGIYDYRDPDAADKRVPIADSTGW